MWPQDGQPVTAPDAVAYGPGPMNGTVVSLAGSEVWVQLAVIGWRICWRLQPDGRTVIEVCDETGVLTGLVVGTRLPIVSADAGWRGKARGADGAKWWWALAIGHALAGTGQPAVTFTRGMPGSRRARPTIVRPGHHGRAVGGRRHRALHDGLLPADLPGASPSHGGRTTRLPLAPVTARRTMLACVRRLA